MATNATLEQPSTSGASMSTASREPLEKWTVKALQGYLRVRGLTFSGMRKNELIAK